MDVTVDTLDIGIKTNYGNISTYILSYEPRD